MTNYPYSNLLRGLALNLANDYEVKQCFLRSSVVTCNSNVFFERDKALKLHFLSFLKK